MLRPGDSVFLRARRLDEQLRTGSPRQRVGAAVGLLGVAATLVRRRSGIQRYRILVSRTVSGDALSALISRPLGPFTAPLPLLFVLDLPATYGDHAPTGADGLGGDSDLLLRSDLQLIRVLDPGTAFAAYALTLGRSPAQTDAADQQLRDVQALPQATTIAVMDQSRAFVGVGTVLADGADAYLVRLVSSSSHEARLPALRMLHEALVMELIDAGVQRLWSDGPFASDLHRQLLHRDLGYRAGFLRLADDRPSP